MHVRIFIPRLYGLHRIRRHQTIRKQEPQIGAHMNMTIEDLTTFLAFTLVILVMVAASLWAIAEEERLGISGMSSERILVRDRLGK